jgi:hypothetical protein
LTETRVIEMAREGAAVRVLVLQHIACESPGIYEDALRERSAIIHRVQLDESEPLLKCQGLTPLLQWVAE